MKQEGKIAKPLTVGSLTPGHENQNGRIEKTIVKIS